MGKDERRTVGGTFGGHGAHEVSVSVIFFFGGTFGGHGAHEVSVSVMHFTSSK